MDDYKNNKNDINSIKKELTRTLMNSLRENEDETIRALIYSGYSYDEIMDMINNYASYSGLDLINCNEIVDRALTK